MVVPKAKGGNGGIEVVLRRRVLCVGGAFELTTRGSPGWIEARQIWKVGHCFPSAGCINIHTVLEMMNVKKIMGFATIGTNRM